MTTKELKSRVKILPAGFGTWKIADRLTGNVGITHDSQAIDRVQSYESEPTRAEIDGYTYKQALQVLFDATK